MNKRNPIYCFIALLVTALMCLNVAVAKSPRGKVSVKSANPNYALQGAKEHVVISGSGFDKGSKVKFLITGTDDDTQIRVLSVDDAFAAEGTLIAEIEVLSTATVTDYDIEVQASNGRRGKGTTLFAVANCTPWPSCRLYNGDGNELYEVEIFGDVQVDGHLWQYDGTTVGFTWRQPNGHGLLDLTTLGGDLADGSNCFRGQGDTGDYIVPLYEAGLRKIRSSSARGLFWFDGFMRDGITPVLYMLKVTGWFTNSTTWPQEDGNFMYLTKWSIAGQGGKAIKRGSCEGSGDDAEFMTVDAYPSP